MNKSGVYWSWNNSTGEIARGSIWSGAVLVQGSQENWHRYYGNKDFTPGYCWDRVSGSSACADTLERLVDAVCGPMLVCSHARATPRVDSYSFRQACETGKTHATT
jgi:hypothetical protein